MGVQFIYTAVTLLPMKLFYSSMLAHGLYLLFMLWSCVHNGASYYFDVFSRKYIHTVVEEAKEESAKKATEQQTAAAAKEEEAKAGIESVEGDIDDTKRVPDVLSQAEHMGNGLAVLGAELEEAVPGLLSDEESVPNSDVGTYMLPSGDV
mmetsp:Transcript_16438/g.33754  ORF Transcript_16438/g.33754 Transcript_16438/m.33754 type:complete len:150 (+) Transcript_16438:3-452(+)